MKTIRSMTIFEVSDLAASVEHYHKLGFATIGEWPEYKVANLQRGDVTVMLQEIETPVPNNNGWAMYIYISDAAKLHADYVSRELDITEISERPWAVGEVQVADHDGHKIAFGQARDETYGPGLWHERGEG